MKQYLDLVQHILNNGIWKDARNARCLTVVGESIKHDLADGFPLLTTKKVSLHNIAVELEGFIGGVTDKRWYRS